MLPLGFGKLEEEVEVEMEEAEAGGGVGCRGAAGAGAPCCSAQEACVSENVGQKENKHNIYS